MQDPLNATATPNPALANFQPLVGRWAVEIIWSEDTHRLVGGPASLKGLAGFEWCEYGRFLRHTIGAEGAPPARWMIGRDETSDEFTALYADSRGVSRVYAMSLAGDVWKIWRSASGFHQRFAACLPARLASGQNLRLGNSSRQRRQGGAGWPADR